MILLIQYWDIRADCGYKRIVLLDDNDRKLLWTDGSDDYPSPAHFDTEGTEENNGISPSTSVG